MNTTLSSRSGRSSVSSGYGNIDQSGSSAAAERRKAALAAFKSQVGQNQPVKNTATPVHHERQGSHGGTKTQRYVGRPRAMSMLDLTLNMRAGALK